MCRLAAYLGPPAPLSVLLSDPPHSLSEQAHQPRLQRDCHVNVDGTGVAWWPEGEAEPLRYATGLPPWSDPNLLGLAPRLRGGVQLALVRSATPGLPFGAGAVAPFVHGGIAVAHNGWIRGFRGAVGRRLLAELPDDLIGQVPTDSAALAGILAARHRADPGAGLAGALTATLGLVHEACTAAGEAAMLTVVAADRTGVVAARASVGTRSPTLFAREHDGGGLLASEPLDPDPAWHEVPERQLVRLGPGGLEAQPLDQESTA